MTTPIDFNASLIGIKKLIPCGALLIKNPETVMPTTDPVLSINGPPLLPGRNIHVTLNVGLILFLPDSANNSL